MKLQTGLLKIHRLEEPVGVWRKLEIYLNGVKIGYVRSGKTFEYELLPTTYSVYVKMDVCYSRPYVFQMEENQIISLDVSLNVDASQALFSMFWGDKSEFYLLSKSKRKNDELD